MLKIIFSTAVLAAASLPAMADQWTRSYHVGAAPELRVNTSDAGVTLHAAAVNTIEVRISSQGLRLGPDDVRVTDHQTGDLVEIDVKFPMHIDFFNFRERWVKIDVTLPIATRTDIHTGDGSIHADGLHGKNRLVSHDGSIEVDGVEGALEATSGDGHIRVRGKFTGLNLRSGDGGINAEVQPGSRMASDWSVNTGDGSVTLKLPDGFAANLVAHTGDGHITVDLPMTARSGEEHELTGKINGGGPTLTIHTGDGSLHLARL